MTILYVEMPRHLNRAAGGFGAWRWSASALTNQITIECKDGAINGVTLADRRVSIPITCKITITLEKTDLKAPSILISWHADGLIFGTTRAHVSTLEDVMLVWVAELEAVRRRMVAVYSRQDLLALSHAWHVSQNRINKNPDESTTAAWSRYLRNALGGAEVLELELEIKTPERVMAMPERLAAAQYQIAQIKIVEAGQAPIPFALSVYDSARRNLCKLRSLLV